MLSSREWSYVLAVYEWYREPGDSERLSHSDIIFSLFFADSSNMLVHSQSLMVWSNLREYKPFVTWIGWRELSWLKVDCAAITATESLRTNNQTYKRKENETANTCQHLQAKCNDSAKDYGDFLYLEPLNCLNCKYLLCFKFDSIGPYHNDRIMHLLNVNIMAYIETSIRHMTNLWWIYG